MERGRVVGFAVWTVAMGLSCHALAQDGAAAENEGAGPATDVEATAASRSSEPAVTEAAAGEVTGDCGPLGALPPDTPKAEPRWEWLRLVTGETFGGDFHGMYDGDVDFDSDEVGRLTLSWGDVAEFHSRDAITVVTITRVVHHGSAQLRDGVLSIDTTDGRVDVAKADVLFINPGGERELDHWYVKASAGLSITNSTVNQGTANWSARVRRRDTVTRLTLDYDGVVSRNRVFGPDEPDGGRLTTTANNQWGLLKFDYFLSKAIYITPASFNAGFDLLQNIRARITPSAGFGVHVLDGQVDFDVELTGAYQYTRFDSVLDDGDEDTQGGGGGYRLFFEWDVSPDVELEVEHRAFVIYSDQADANSFDQSTFRVSSKIEIDVTSILDFDVNFIWDRVLEPPIDENGQRPQANSYTVGVALGIEAGQ